MEITKNRTAKDSKISNDQWSSQSNGRKLVGKFVKSRSIWTNHYFCLSQFIFRTKAIELTRHTVRKFDLFGKLGQAKRDQNFL